MSPYLVHESGHRVTSSQACCDPSLARPQRDAPARAHQDRPGALNLGHLSDLIDDFCMHLTGLGVVGARETDRHPGPAPHDVDLERLQNGHAPHGIASGGLNVLGNMTRSENGHRENRSVRGHTTSVERSTAAPRSSEADEVLLHVVAQGR